jgi:hypothetical protein
MPESNAWLTSKKTAKQYCWLSNALFIISVRRWHCCIVECAFRKPNWCRGIHAWKCVSLYILLSRSFSKILDITGKRLIGLYEVTSVGFFPGFGIMMIFACFRGTRQNANLVIPLNMYRRVCRLSGGIFCIIWAVMRSEPDTLSGLSCFITCLSSVRVKACRFSECRGLCCKFSFDFWIQSVVMKGKYFR